MYNIKKIVVIRRDNIGDLVCTTPLIKALRDSYPNAEIIALVNSYNEPVLRGNVNLNRVYAYRKLKHVQGVRCKFAALVERFGLIIRLRYWRADLAVLAKSSYDRHGLRFARQINAKHVVGYLSEALSGEVNPDIGVDRSKILPGHEVEEIGELMSPLGFRPSFGKLKVYPICDVVKKFESLIPSSSGLRIGLHISAREQSRRLGLQKFCDLSSRILHEWPKANLLIFWSPGKTDDPYHPGDDESIHILNQQIGSPRFLPVATSDPRELIAALSLCDVFIGADGGAMHIAAALNKPIVALFENTEAKLKHWYPWGVPHRLVHGPGFEVSSIDVKRIVDMLKELVTGSAAKL